MEFSRCIPQRQRSSDQQGTDMALAKLMGHECRRGRAGIVGHLGKDDGPGLDFTDATQRVETESFLPAAGASSSSVFRNRTQGCSQPSRVSASRYSCSSWAGSDRFR